MDVKYGKATIKIRYLLLSFLSLVFAGSLMAQTVERGPYLQTAGESQIIIKWRTDLPTQSIVDYGTNSSFLNQSAVDYTLKTEHELLIDDLTPGTLYYYRITDLDNILVAASDDLYFKTHPAIGTNSNYQFWVLGDCGTKNNNQRAVRDAYYDYIGSEHTDGILFLGDNAYSDGTDAEYQEAVFENMYEEKLKNTVAWSTLGNHDGFSASANSQTGPYFDIFSFPTAGESGGVPSGTEAYYSFDYGNIHFICLESYETDPSVGGAMYNWCENDLQNTTQDWIVAFWHHPPYSKSSHDSDAEGDLADMRENFVPLLESYGVDLVLSGHSHTYERSYLINGHYDYSGTYDASEHTVGPTGGGSGRADAAGAYQKDVYGPQAGEGSVYITAGCSGKSSQGNGALDHPAMFYSVNQLGSCSIEVFGNSMNVKFIRETGSIDDYFTINKNFSCPSGSPCDDGEVCTTNDMWQSDCSCAGSPVGDSDADGICDAEDICSNGPDPGSPCNDNDPATVNDQIDSNCNCLGSDPVFCVQISAGIDDVEESGVNGNPYVNSSDLEMVYDSHYENQTIGLRFNGIAVPQGASISDAYLQFTADEISSAPCDLIIQAEDSDDAPGFSGNSYYDVSARSKTASNIGWSVDPWYFVGESGFNQRSPDLSDLVSEVVNRAGYAQGNSMVFTLSGTGVRTAMAYEKSVASAPELCITYSTGNPTCPNAGLPCDDGDACTINDTYDSACSCVGLPDNDSDADGVCDAQDACPGLDDALIGTACDDGDACTTNDLWQSNCWCAGSPPTDSDGDGICDEQDSCAGLDDTLIGTTCDDGNDCTVNDLWQSDCTCSGTPDNDSDADGVCDSQDICQGMDDMLMGTPCDDGNACTVQDIWQNCSCFGIADNDSDNDGICDSQDACPGFDDALLGTVCDDGDDCTENDLWQSDCSCKGDLASDSDFDNVCDALDLCPGVDDAIIGTVCDDGNSCTSNDLWQSDCNCSGTPDSDADLDGVCDSQDLCPGFDDALIGTACDDGNDCSANDLWQNDCKCVGEPESDSDFDGVCDAQDVCQGLNDAWIGTPCNDTDPCTENDIWTTDCSCEGTLMPCTEQYFYGRVLLEGAYFGGGHMRTDLKHLIPLNQPYDLDPYDYSGSESISAPSDEMVDWVLIEARLGEPNLTGDRGTLTIETRAGILLQNGTIVSHENSNSGIRFNSLDPGEKYHFCIRHRNHLDVFTTAVYTADGAIFVDLRLDETAALGNEQLKKINDGYVAMHAGDYNQDGTIQLTDHDNWMIVPASVEVYELEDGNLDGVIQTTDVDLWRLNKAKIGAVEIDY